MELQVAFYKRKLARGFLSQHAPRAVCNACTHYKQLMSILQRWAKYIVWYLSLDLHIIMYNYYRNLCRIIFNCSFRIFVIGWASWYWICEVWNLHSAGLPVVGWRNFLFLMKILPKSNFMITMYGFVWMNIHSDQYKYNIYEYIRVLLVCFLACSYHLSQLYFSPGWFSYVLVKCFV